MTFYILLLILILVMGYLLLMPIELFIDTAENEYYIQAKGLMKISVETDAKELILLRLKLPFYNFKIYPLKASIKTKKVKSTQKKKVKNLFKLKKGLQLLKSFKVKLFRLDLDTGNYVQNAQLWSAYPIFNQFPGRININFEGRNELLLSIQNRPIYIIKSFINF